MERHVVDSGTAWEARVGYARAVRVGDHVFVSGTTGVDSTGRVAPGGAAAQARQAVANISSALEKVGASLRDVVRTRVYLTNATDWEPVTEVHRETFREWRPASSMLVVSALTSPELVVEIEADAVVSG